MTWIGFYLRDRLQLFKNANGEKGIRCEGTLNHESRLGVIIDTFSTSQ
jgi:hypothetical protein